MQTITKNEIKKLTSSEISDKILEVQKNLFELKLKQATKQNIKTHLFKKNRRALAQLLTEQKKFNKLSTQ